MKDKIQIDEGEVGGSVKEVVVDGPQDWTIVGLKCHPGVERWFGFDLIAF